MTRKLYMGSRCHGRILPTLNCLGSKYYGLLMSLVMALLCLYKIPTEDRSCCIGEVRHLLEPLLDSRNPTQAVS